MAILLKIEKKIPSRLKKGFHPKITLWKCPYQRSRPPPRSIGFGGGEKKHLPTYVRISFSKFSNRRIYNR